MMRTQKVLVIFLTLFLFVSCQKQEPKTISLMTWNIWNGGIEGRHALDSEEDEKNTVNILKVIQQQDPDIIFMQETYCCGMDIAKQAGYPYSSRGSSNLSIHSKYPIIDSVEIFDSFNSFGVIIDVDGEKVLCVDVWLHYLPDYFEDIKTMSPDSLIFGEKATRHREISIILKEVDSLEKVLQMPIILSGDFNSGSHLDWVESTRAAHYDKVVEWPVSKTMLDNDYTDTFREANPDPTKTLDGTWGFLSDNIISDRIDFIYYKGNDFKTLSSKIVQDDPPGGFFNSDHRAIYSVLELK